MRPEPDRVRLAAEALARARADAWARGDRPQVGNNLPGRMVSKDSSSERTGATDGSQLPPSWSARPHREDPQPLNTAVDGLLSARGWQQRAAVGAVFGKWAEIVGPQLAAHTAPGSFDEGELTVSADSDAWAAQVRLLTPRMLSRLSEELVTGTVTRITVRGPAHHRAKRGPRDSGAPPGKHLSLIATKYLRDHWRSDTGALSSAVGGLLGPLQPQREAGGAVELRRVVRRPSRAPTELTETPQAPGAPAKRLEPPPRRGVKATSKGRNHR